LIEVRSTKTDDNINSYFEFVVKDKSNTRKTLKFDVLRTTTKLVDRDEPVK
jgi:hypothetical protein